MGLSVYILVGWNCQSNGIIGQGPHPFTTLKKAAVAAGIFARFALTIGE